MTEQKSESRAFAVSDDDRLWAALGWLPLSPLWPLIAILALLLQDKGQRPFIREHAIQSIVTGIALIPVAIFTFGMGALLYLVMFYWAYLAYQGRRVKVPVVYDWVERQGWFGQKRVENAP